MSSILIRTTGQLGSYLKSLRRLRGWSQEQRGNKIGLSQERIVKIENAPEKVRFDALLTIRIFARPIAEWSPPVEVVENSAGVSLARYAYAARQRAR